MLTLLVVLACIFSGTIGGVFFAFSAFITKALARLPTSQGVAAMQQINVVVLNPLFLGIFMGAAVLSLFCVVASFLPWSAPRSPLLLAAGLLYLVGTWGVTIAFNVPRNNRLASTRAESQEARAYWLIYVREWCAWNHVRTVAAIASSACCAISLAT